MRNRVLIAMLTALWGIPALAAAPAWPAFEVGERLNPTDPMAERETRWSHPGITLTALTYSTVPGYRPLRLDLYRQERATAARPLVVFIHGGGWTFGNPRAGAGFRDLPSILASLAERGFVVAAIEYRLSREATFPAQTEDVTAALAYLRTNATRLGIDPARIVAWGMSAGAHLGALNALTCPQEHCVQGFVGWFGVYDMQAYLAETEGIANGRVLLGCATAPCSREALAAASPIDHVHPGAPPVLLLNGLDDDITVPRQAQEFGRRLREAGNAVELVLLPESGHGFIGTDTAKTKVALQQALTATFDFFDRVLRPANPAP
jgi:acetyl esterase/lipase